MKPSNPFQTGTPAVLVLANGRVFKGSLRGAIKPIAGEVIFNTAVTGYQEILTDPSYYGQIVVMTSTHIGNYGINQADAESDRPFATALIMRELSPIASSWRSSSSLEEYAIKHQIPLLENIDTRALVTALREQGAVPGLIAPLSQAPLEQLIKQASVLPVMEGQNLVAKVASSKGYAWQSSKKPCLSVIAYDYGIKHSILNMLQKYGIAVEILPHNTSYQTILAKNPAGLFLSNGPGDPKMLKTAVQQIHALLGKVPIFGICLGCQLLALALGAKTYKLKFGHHGVNHPVLRLADGKVEITSQNHGFVIREDNLPDQLKITHRNLNDQTIAGIEATQHPAFAVQYHPEASPGPHDSHYLFEQFSDLIHKHSATKLAHTA